MTPDRLCVLIAPLLSCAVLSGCTDPKPAATETPAPATTAASQPASQTDVFRFKIGALDAVALKDGDIDAANDGKTFAVGHPAADVAALLERGGLPTEVLHLSVQPLLVRSGTHVLLFDTGAGDAKWARAGRLPAALRAADVEPSQVTDIFISHRHRDHIGGLVTAEGALAFPNAAIHITSAEWEALKADKDEAALVAAITPKAAPFQSGAELVPGVVTAVSAEGHTSGHSAYEIASGDARLLYLGDTAHHYVISVQRPEWTIAFDENASQAQTFRRALMQRAADQKLRVYAVHFPFPGLGRFEVQDDGFVWMAER